MIVFKDYLPSLLPDYIHQEDSYKDVSGKGFVVRYLEIFGEELDDEYYSKIEGLLDNLDVLTASSIYVQYFATMLGDLDRLIADEHNFRKFLSYIASIYKVKGTKRSFIAILAPLGLTATIYEVPIPNVAYDVPGINYDAGILYDTSCPICSDYELTVVGVPLTGEIYRRMLALIALVEPINTKLSKITYNGNEITSIFIEVYIDEHGDLIYNNENDPDLILTLENGDLIIEGPNAALYFLDSDGNLNFVI